MKATRILIREHEIILRMLSHLSRARDMLENNIRPPSQFFEIATGFARVFADEYHHFKEEYLMFGLLANKKEGTLDMEIGTLRFQHERCRGCVREIQNAMDGYAEEDGIATTLLLEHLSAYISLLRCHIHMEDHVFFPLFDKLIDKDEEKLLLRQFDISEKETNGQPGPAKDGLHLLFTGMNLNKGNEIVTEMDRMLNEFGHPGG